MCQFCKCMFYMCSFHASGSKTSSLVQSKIPYMYKKYVPLIQSMLSMSYFVSQVFFVALWLLEYLLPGLQHTVFHSTNCSEVKTIYFNF